MQNPFGVNKGADKKSRIIPGSEYMSRLATTNLLSEYSQGLAYWTYKYYSGHTITIYLQF